MIQIANETAERLCRLSRRQALSSTTPLQPYVTQQGSESASSDDDSGLSDDDGCSSEDEQKRSSTSKHSRWSDLDEQRLLAYKKESKSWEGIFGKFPSRTQPTIRTRWNIVRPRGD
ncbi:hypothetical protein DL98DRAFT_509343 [Cadophora sp. DSE1049]|nr:hypothetical protein DL98DRAFT_509343 [Cadophora sp. DSE1049]